MAKNYVSNSSESVRMFKNNFLESMSKVHFSVPLYIFVPAVLVFGYLAVATADNLLWVFGYFLSGLLTWTVTEYVLHRFVFHWEPSSNWGKRIHFIFHGVHHDYPRDEKRLVMPLSVSIPLATLFYFGFGFLFTEQSHRYAHFAGFILGYLTYDMMHYAIHHHSFKWTFLKKIQQHHILHHYDNPHKGFGVSSGLWDVILGSGFPKKVK